MNERAAPAGLCFEELSIGQAAERVSEVTEDVIAQFANVSGDRNPVHLDAAYAATTAFKERIAHGMLSAAYISAVLGMDLPGPGAIYVSQSLNFLRPVKIGAQVTARVEVKALDEKTGRVTFACTCSVGGKKVLDGEAVVIAPRKAA
ncbi:MAG: MaoC family dehydratase [Caulobacterales bacterium]